jgi:hypothetical protein
MTDVMILVCARVKGPLLLADNRTGRCAECGHRVQYRPHAPKAILRCIPCAVDLIEPNTELITTQQMIDDAMAVIRKKQS